MNKRRLTDIFIYPVKGMGGIRLDSSQCEIEGLKFDRRWMLIDDSYRFVSQREFTQLALVKVREDGDNFLLEYQGSGVAIPKSIEDKDKLEVSVWGDQCGAFELKSQVNDWASDILKKPVRFVYQDPQVRRSVDKNFSKFDEGVSFADGYPYLILGQASVDYLNDQLDEKVLADRFRANLIFSGGEVHEEDNWKDFRIGKVEFYGAKPCSRCQVIMINQQTGEVGKEPTKTLASYRKFNNKIKFGENALCKSPGVINLGDEITLS